MLLSVPCRASANQGALVWLVQAVCCWAGQLSQDGGQTVKLFLHMLRQLLILLVPVEEDKQIHVSD